MRAPRTRLGRLIDEWLDESPGLFDLDLTPEFLARNRRECDALLELSDDAETDLDWPEDEPRAPFTRPR